MIIFIVYTFFFSSRRRHTRCGRDWSSDVCSSDLPHMGGQAVRALFSAPEVRYTRLDQPAEFWGLGGSASVNGKQLTLTVTNPHASETRGVEIVVRGARATSTQARVLSAPDLHAHNTFENPEAVEPRNEQVTANAGAISFRFPPASVTRLQVALV